jgi:hypothetical protein
LVPAESVAPLGTPLIAIASVSDGSVSAVAMLSAIGESSVPLAGPA